MEHLSENENETARPVAKFPRRSWISSFLVALVGVVCAWLLRGEIAYFFQFGGPLDLGLAEELSPRPLPHNSYVSVRGVARDMCVRSQVSRRQVRFLYLMGSAAAGRVIVESPAAAEAECLGAEDRNFRGRLIKLQTAKRYRPVLEYYADNFPDAPPPEQAMVLREGVLPFDYWWAPALVASLWAAAAVHFWLAARLRRQTAAGAGGEKWDCKSTTP